MLVIHHIESFKKRKNCMFDNLRKSCLYHEFTCMNNRIEHEKSFAEKIVWFSLWLKL